MPQEFFITALDSFADIVIITTLMIGVVINRDQGTDASLGFATTRSPGSRQKTAGLGFKVLHC